MYRTLILVTIVVLATSTVASAWGYRKPDIRQTQSTSLSVRGGTSGYGGSVATSGGAITARQSAYDGRTKTATQSASTSIGSTSASWWGAVRTWFSGWASTWQSQSVD